MELSPFEKLVIIEPLRRSNGRVIGIKNEPDGSKTYFIEPLTIDFYHFKNGARILKITTQDIETERIKIEKHII